MADEETKSRFEKLFDYDEITKKYYKKKIKE